jgi:hypothetical protein
LPSPDNFHLLCSHSNARQKSLLEMSLHEVKQLQLNDLDVFNSLFWWQWLENGKWNGMKWEKMKKKEEKKNYWRPSQNVLSCLVFLVLIYMAREWDIIMLYVYMAKDWKKRQCSNICSTLHSPMCLRVSVCLFVPLNCTISFSSFLLLVLLELFVNNIRELFK